jgi:hypothetical protein
MNDIKKLLEDFIGAEVNISESPKSVEQREKELFIELLETLEVGWKNDHELFENHGVDLSGFSQYLYHAIETLIMLKYGAYRAEIFWWYVLDRFDTDGSLLGLEDEDGKVYHFKTHKQFYNFFKKLK